MKKWNNSINWSTWQCATCDASQEDPDTINKTCCSNGHTNYLGVIEGQHRRAYKSSKERSAEIREHGAFVKMFSDAISAGRAQIIKGGRKPNL